MAAGQLWYCTIHNTHLLSYQVLYSCHMARHCLLHQHLSDDNAGPCACRGPKTFSLHKEHNIAFFVACAFVIMFIKVLTYLLTYMIMRKVLIALGSSTHGRAYAGRIYASCTRHGSYMLQVCYPLHQSKSCQSRLITAAVGLWVRMGLHTAANSVA